MDQGAGNKPGVIDAKPRTESRQPPIAGCISFYLGAAISSYLLACDAQNDVACRAREGVRLSSVFAFASALCLCWKLLATHRFASSVGCLALWLTQLRSHWSPSLFARLPSLPSLACLPYGGSVAANLRGEPSPHAISISSKRGPSQPHPTN